MYVILQINGYSISITTAKNKHLLFVLVFYEWFTPTVSMSDHQAPERSCEFVSVIKQFPNRSYNVSIE